MLPHQAPAPQTPRRVGVGIDTSRYGHYAAFLKDDLQPAADELQFPESAAGYARFRQRLEGIRQRHGPVRFVVRLDAAGQYADNLLHFLHGLGGAGTEDAPAPFALTLSCGDPQRNKNYRAALFGSKKSDPIEARAAARFALTETPTPVTPLSLALRSLRQVAGRLQAVVRQRTRLINQLHHLLALTFPELALLTKDLVAGWVLELVHRYPTAARLATATTTDLANIPYLPDAQIAPLLEQARTSIASLVGDTAEELVRDHVRQLRDVSARQKRLEKLLVAAYQALPQANHLDTLPGIGAVTAAVLTAFILDIDRFQSPGKLVAYFGALPIEASSGVDRDGQARAPRRFVMSRRGNDLVRRYLWMAALSAIRCNPAVRALYARVVAKHPQEKAIAVGHAMRKLLHLVFAVWKTGRPFNPHHYPWQAPAHVAAPDQVPSAPDQAAGHTPDTKPAPQGVTAACADSVETVRKAPRPGTRGRGVGVRGPKPRKNPPPHPNPSPPSTGARGFSDSLVAAAAAIDDSAYIDFGHLKRQLPLARVLDQLGWTARLRGSGPQRRCACPLHRGDARGRTFSVNLNDNVFQCFDTKCGHKGDVIDLWAAVHGIALREAALDLVRTFGLEPAPRTGTEKRHG